MDCILQLWFLWKIHFFSWRILDILSKERKLVIHLLSTRWILLKYAFPWFLYVIYYDVNLSYYRSAIKIMQYTPKYCMCQFIQFMYKYIMCTHLIMRIRVTAHFITWNKHQVLDCRWGQQMDQENLCKINEKNILCFWWE